MKISQDETNGVLKIAGTLDIGCAGALRDALAACVQQLPRPGVDLSEVEECDTAGLQILCAALKSAARNGKPLAVLAPQAVDEACAAIGLSLEPADGKRGDDSAA